jgi:hypothetical protein
VAPPVDEATRTYQTAYDVCHSDPAFAARLYQQAVDKADPQSDLYSRANMRLEALSSALADRKHPEAARLACDQAARWMRPSERVEADRSPRAESRGASQPDAEQDSHSPRAESRGAVTAAEPPRSPREQSRGDASEPGSAGHQVQLAVGASDSPWSTPLDSARGERVAGSASGAGSPLDCSRGERGPCSASGGGAPLDCSRGERGACSARATSSPLDSVPGSSPIAAPAPDADAFPPPPLIPVPPPELSSPPLVALPPPPLAPPPLVAARASVRVPRPPARVVVRQDPGTELVSAILGVFGAPRVTVYVPAPRPPRR